MLLEMASPSSDSALSLTSLQFMAYPFRKSFASFCKSGTEIYGKIVCGGHPCEQISALRLFCETRCRLADLSPSASNTQSPQELHAPTIRQVHLRPLCGFSITFDQYAWRTMDRECEGSE